MATLELQNVGFCYHPSTPQEKQALRGVSLTLQPGECLGIAGANGSGKSTLAQVMNGLLIPSVGKLRLDGREVDEACRWEMWRKVGLVFQYPEQQLFAPTVWEDVAFGLLNQGLSRAEARQKAEKALFQVGLDPQQIGEASPLALSGGMRRRVAIAGVLAMEPEIFILDEPTAGLDALGREQILSIIGSWREQKKGTVVVISHSLGELLAVADRLLLMVQGQAVYDGQPGEASLEQMGRYLGLEAVPEYLWFFARLQERGCVNRPTGYSRREIEEEIIRCWEVKKHERAQNRTVHSGRFPDPPDGPADQALIGVVHNGIDSAPSKNPLNPS